MKKLILALLVAMFVASCEGPVGPEGPQGRPGVNGAWFSDKFTVTSDAWVLTDGSLQYEFSGFFELTDYIKNNGAVAVYRVYDDGVQEPLPMTYVNKENDDYQWSEIFTYQYNRGKLRFIYDCSDKDFSVRPGNMVFRVVMIW